MLLVVYEFVDRLVDKVSGSVGGVGEVVKVVLQVPVGLAYLGRDCLTILNVALLIYEKHICVDKYLRISNI